ncbi:hypothetical protein BR93DRAFT_925534 [Coniochaeta sp. PMI_546]|nr:hypothetical protein BR93DRAFT_925534 [Coniochaeta sp. PMI_546]
MLLLHGTMLLTRAQATTQCLADYNPCGQGLPANFCCSSDTKCMVLASNTTALCCPQGHDCSAITPTTCDVTLMNADDHPNSQILTTALDAELPSCGTTTCCPFGYDCVASGGSLRCVMGKNQATYTSLVSQHTKGVLPTISGSTTSPIPTPTTTSHATPTLANTSSTVTSTAAADAASGIGQGPGAEGSRSAGLIAGSVVAALVLLVGLAILFWTKRRKLSKHLGSLPASRPLPHQHQWQYQAATYDFRKTDPMKASQIKPATFCENLTSSPGYVSVVAFTELEGSTVAQPPPSATHGAQSPVELPASPVSFSMWSRQQDNRRSIRKSSRTTFKPPRATFIPLSRFAAMHRPGHSDEGDNWI